MKFGHNLPRNQVPEWSASYIDYKRLKKLIKSAALDAQAGATADLTEFYFQLDRNLEDVDDLYNKKFADASRRLRLLQERHGASPPTIAQLEALDRDELEELMGTLLELRGQLRRLQWYGEVNRRGFVKITKKLEKKLPGVVYQHSYLTSKVDPRPFATNRALGEDMKKVNDWLSLFGEVRAGSDASSTKSGASGRIVSARAIINLPPGLLDTVEQAIRNDDAAMLDELLLETNTDVADNDSGFQKLLHNLLQRAISSQSRRCIKTLLGQLRSLADEDDIDERNCIHRLVISIGRSKYARHKAERSIMSAGETRQFLAPAEMPMRPTLARSRSEVEKSASSPASDDSLGLLSFVLDNLLPAQRQFLNAKDSYGRLPLHYATEYGSIRACEIIIARTRVWDPTLLEQGLLTASWEDGEGLTPLHLSIINKHVPITKLLIKTEDADDETLDDGGARPLKQHCSGKSTSILSLATESNQYEILRLLVKAGFDINQQDRRGEVPLHLAARFGHVESAQVLLDGGLGQQPNIDVVENSFAWTPLFIASVDGHLAIVKLLVAAGADTTLLDSSGWSAREHAALRGHLDIARCLTDEAPTTGSDEVTEVSSSPKSVTPISGSLEDRRSRLHNGDVQPMKTVKPVKTFGHRYLTDEAMILVSLGSMDPRKQIEPVKLDAIPLAHAHSTQLDTALSLVVTASGATGDAEVVDLPSQENLSTEPFYFLSKEPSKVKLLFDIVPTYAGNASQIVGRGVAMLGSMKTTVGSKRMNLQGDMSVPILAASTLEPIGVVNFNFMVITPFSHPNMSLSENHTYWRKTAPVVIGHRGLGKNFGAGRRSLQLGENTIQSFIAAANLGASYVEFDVQLTKDHVPVIYHDFLVSETGIDAPVHTLTLEQFLHVSEAHSPHHSRSASPRGLRADNNNTPTGSSNSTSAAVASSTGSNDAGDNPRPRPRAMSVGSSDSDYVQLSALDRMKHTRDVKARGWKANMYGNVIKQPFTTLAEMFAKLPESIGFNIEMKYPMLFESEEQDMDTYAVELNSFVDTVLQLVYDRAAARHVIFSSFHPDICLLLSFKQPSIPVLFLTDAGANPVGDIRASSLQEAIRFTSRWNMLGVVSAAEPLVMCPRLVRVVKESGLICVSYGMLNNVPENVKAQVDEGIDAVIVDHVAAFRKGLTA